MINHTKAENTRNLYKQHEEMNARFSMSAKQGERRLSLDLESRKQNQSSGKVT